MTMEDLSSIVCLFVNVGVCCVRIRGHRRKHSGFGHNKRTHHPSPTHIKKTRILHESKFTHPYYTHIPNFSHTHSPPPSPTYAHTHSITDINDV